MDVKYTVGIRSEFSLTQHITIRHYGIGDLGVGELMAGIALKGAFHMNCISREHGLLLLFELTFVRRQNIVSVIEIPICDNVFIIIGANRISAALGIIRQTQFYGGRAKVCNGYGSIYKLFP